MKDEPAPRRKPPMSFSISLPQEEGAAFKERVAQYGTSTGEVLRRAVADYMATHPTTKPLINIPERSYVVASVHSRLARDFQERLKDYGCSLDMVIRNAIISFINQHPARAKGSAPGHQEKI